LGRDRSRIADARVRMNESPYSSGDISGTSFNYNIEMPARILGFSKASNNSVDAICSRDYAIEFLAIAANSIITLSRLSGEMIDWHSTSRKFIEFSNAFVEQSEVLPYKRDPEALEMIRAKSAKVCGGLSTVMMIVKGLPMEYSGDYREISEPVISSYDNLLNCLNTMSAMVADFTTNRKKMKEAASQEFSTTIDLVEWLLQNVTPSQSEAQRISREIVEYAITKGKKLSLLELTELKKIEPKINNDVYSALIPSRAMIGRRSGNGSNPVQIRKAIRAARREYL
jgi:argininosuccinate lyase